MVVSFQAHLSANSTSNQVLVSDQLWSNLVQSTPGATPDVEELAIAVENKFPLPSSLASRTKPGKQQRKQSSPASLVALARKAPAAFLKTLAKPPPRDEQTIFLPPSLLASSQFNHSLERPSNEVSLPTLLVSPTRLIELTSIVLLSLDWATYHAGIGGELHGDEEGIIVREGGVLELEGGSLVEGLGGRRWRVAMTEPVLQGVIRKGTTKFLVLPPSGEEAVEEGDAPRIEDGLATEEKEDQEGEEEEEEEQDFDIDESFLAASLLAPTPQPTPSFALALTNGHPTSSTLPLGSLSPSPLLHPIPSALLIPRPTPEEDDTARCYLRMSDLGRIGMFSGDWAVVKLSEKGKDSRLVRVFAADYLTTDWEEPQDGSAPAFFPPTFLWNMASSSRLSLSPFPSATTAAYPDLPLAASLTVARLASPYSINKAFLPLFLEALKHWFKGRKRIIKKGDLVAVGICEDEARFSLTGEEERVILPSSSAEPTAVVFFQITSLTVSPPPAPKSTLITNGVDTQSLEDLELNDQLAAGDFGICVDPRVTKLIQTGVEQGRVPDVGGFLGIAKEVPTLPLLSVVQLALASQDGGGEGQTPATRLKDYLLAALRPGAEAYDLHLTVLLKGARGSGKRTVVRNVATVVGMHLLELDAYDLLGETDLKTEGTLRARIDKAVSCAPCVLLLRNLEALARKSQVLQTGQEPAMANILKECFEVARQGWKKGGFPIVIVATTCDVDKIPMTVLGLFKEEIGIEAPSEPERLAILRSLTANDIVAPDVSLRALAIQTAALVANDLVDLVRRARVAAGERVFQSITASSSSKLPLQLSHLVQAGLALTSTDFNHALEKARSSYSESIGAPKIPNVTWDDVGGLKDVKDDILDTIQLPLEHPELFADGLKKRSGILLYGPPGTGKTLLAKAVATSCSLNFFSIKGPELLNMYIGESEANVRRVFQRARDAKPCVIFFDELDSVAPKRGNQGDSGGVMDRIVSQLLAELDGMAEGKGGSDVFVIGATNRPDLLDPALLRPGRFDRMLYLGVSDNHDSQLKIIQALTRKFKMDPAIRLEEVAQRCPFNYTGADFYALCSDAMLKAMTRKAEEIDTKLVALNSQPPYSTSIPLTPQYYLAEMATPAEIEVLVSQADFEAALAELVPSVSKAEMLHYKIVQQRFSGETMNSAEAIEKKGKVEQRQIEMPLPIEKIGSSSNGTGGKNGDGDGEDAPPPTRRDKGKGREE